MKRKDILSKRTFFGAIGFLWTISLILSICGKESMGVFFYNACGALLYLFLLGTIGFEVRFLLNALKDDDPMWKKISVLRFAIMLLVCLILLYVNYLIYGLCGLD